MATLEAKNLFVKYKTKNGFINAMEDVSLTVQEGEFVCLLGPSGCGKSTFLNLTAGFIHPTSGELTLDGVKITKPGRERGVVFQEHALFPFMTIEDNIRFGLKIKGVKKEQQEEIIDKYLGMMGLKAFRKSFPKELSGGMRQRTAIARALANEPEILLMDEPYSALDEQTRHKLQKELSIIWEKTGSTIIFITHSIDEALILASRIVVMTPRPGKIYKIFDMTKYGRPRDESNPELMMIKDEINEILKMHSAEEETIHE